jgi:apolipoprotein N-acyltransferase
MVTKKDIIRSIFSGLLLVLIFPPFDFYPLAWFALIPLLISLTGKKLTSSLFLGILTGFIYFIGTIYWVYHSMYYYGNIPAILSVLLLFLLCLYLALYIGIFSVLFTYLSKRSRFPALFIIPVVWVSLEIMRTYIFTGFPWSVLGYSQHKFTTVIQLADITGVYGVSFLITAVNGALFDIFHWPKKVSRMPLFGHWHMTLGLLSLVFAILFSLFYGMWKFRTDEAVHGVRASVVQGNIKQDEKWDISYQKKIIEIYKRLTKKAVQSSPDLIVWPETALPFIFGKEESLTAEIVEFQKKTGIHLLFGSVLVHDMKESEYELSNSALLLSPAGKVVSVYDKIHLVPYGEYVPLRRLFPFLEKLVAGIGDFITGKEYTVMNKAPARISTLICYEIIFPGMVRKFVDRGANLLVSLTNDAWFGPTSAPYQHFSMAILRAVENRVPVIRAANTGISGFIDAKGRVRGKSDIFVEDVMTAFIPLGSLEKSFYTKYGDLFAFLCIISCVLLISNNIYTRKEHTY